MLCTWYMSSQVLGQCVAVLDHSLEGYAPTLLFIMCSSYTCKLIPLSSHSFFLFFYAAREKACSEPFSSYMYLHITSRASYALWDAL